MKRVRNRLAASLCIMQFFIGCHDESTPLAPNRVDAKGAVSASVCGNNIVEEAEQCDDGNNNPADGCHQCKLLAPIAPQPIPTPEPVPVEVVPVPLPPFAGGGGGGGGSRPDSDDDGVANLVDNCDSVSNRDQADTDSDGVGDPCDADPRNPLVGPLSEPLLFVSPHGSDGDIPVVAMNNTPIFSNTCTDVDNPCLTLRHAILVAPDSAFIVVAPGTYAEEDLLINKNLSIYAEVSTSKPVIDATGEVDGDLESLERVFTIDSGYKVTLAGLALTGGNASSGGAVYNSGELTLSNVDISANSATGLTSVEGGGGVFNDAGILAILNSTLKNNSALGTAGSGGAIFNRGGAATLSNTFIKSNTASRAGGGIELAPNTIVSLNGFDPSPATISITGGELSDNTTASNPGNGGGIHITGNGNATITDTVVNANFASREGGGLWNGSGTMSLMRVTINANTASGIAADDGGGGIFNNGGTLSIIDSTITNNLANGTSGSGGGLFSLGGSAHISRTTIKDNSASRAGGGIESAPASVIALDSDDDPRDPATAAPSLEATIVITESDIAQNTASANPGNGGGIHNDAGTLTVRQSTIRANSAANQGGGLWNRNNGAVTVENSTISGNISTNGAGIWAGLGTISLSGATIAANTNGTAFVFVSTDTTPIVSHTVIAATPFAACNNTLTMPSHTIATDASCGVTVADPLLGPLADNGGPTLTHLPLLGSPLIDAGTTDCLLALDQRSETRPFDYPGVGPASENRCDIGSVELH